MSEFESKVPVITGGAAASGELRGPASLTLRHQTIPATEDD